MVCVEMSELTLLVCGLIGFGIGNLSGWCVGRMSLKHLVVAQEKKEK